jgi:hypothetical protein
METKAQAIKDKFNKMNFIMRKASAVYMLFFFFFWWYLGLNSGPHACCKGTLPLEPFCQSCFCCLKDTVNKTRRPTWKEDTWKTEIQEGLVSTISKELQKLNNKKTIQFFKKRKGFTRYLNREEIWMELKRHLASFTS